MLMVLFILLVLLAVLGLNLREIVDSQTFQDNWAFVKGIFMYVWDHFLHRIVNLIWNMVIAPLLSHTATQLQQQIATSSSSII